MMPSRSWFARKSGAGWSRSICKGHPAFSLDIAIVALPLASTIANVFQKRTAGITKNTMKLSSRLYKNVRK
jgi:hypothetical protein